MEPEFPEYDNEPEFSATVVRMSESVMPNTSVSASLFYVFQSESM